MPNERIIWPVTVVYVYCSSTETVRGLKENQNAPSLDLLETVRGVTLKYNCVALRNLDLLIKTGWGGICPLYC